MVRMSCPPGACLWTSDSTAYCDDGSGEMLVEDGHHVEEAIAAGWRILSSKATGDNDDLSDVVESTISLDLATATAALAIKTGYAAPLTITSDGIPGAPVVRRKTVNINQES